MEYAAKQAPDGYTFLLGNFGPVTANPLMTRVKYNVAKDFVPVSQITRAANILVVPVTLPVKNVKELVGLAKKNPGVLTYATSGPGSMSHLAGEMFKRLANVDVVTVPYQGGVFSIASGFTFSGGILDGNGVLGGPVTVSGTAVVEPGGINAAGTIAIGHPRGIYSAVAGDYTQNGGTLHIERAGALPGVSRSHAGAAENGPACAAAGAESGGFYNPERTDRRRGRGLDPDQGGGC